LDAEKPSAVVPATLRERLDSGLGAGRVFRWRCYYASVFNFGRPKTAGQWISHFLLGVVALFLVWWMLRVYVH
jgi:hypothetical protein